MAAEVVLAAFHKVIPRHSVRPRIHVVAIMVAIVLETHADR